MSVLPEFVVLDGMTVRTADIIDQTIDGSMDECVAEEIMRSLRVVARGDTERLDLGAAGIFVFEPHGESGQ
jgi:hypothetical protein